jgi:uncharacterized protein
MVIKENVFLFLHFMFDAALSLLSSPLSILVYVLGAFVIGLSKTGIPNLGTLAIPFFVFIFGAKSSTGIILILLCMADVVAVIYYRKKFIWDEVKKLLPMSAVGLIVAVVFGKYINDHLFKLSIGLCILFGMLIMFWTERAGASNVVVNHRWYSPFFGFIMGFSTMIGNAAGPALSVYMLSLRLDKISFTATAAWFIMILNFSKIPLQLFVWHNLSWDGFVLNLMAFPIVLLGGYCGIIILKKMPEQRFRKVVMTLVVLSALLLLV